MHASDADAPTARSARRARGRRRPGKMNGGLCQLPVPGYLFTASHKGQAPPNHDATANSPLLLWVWGCRCDVPRCAPLARLALYSPCPCPCRAADCGVALGWQHAPAHGDTGHGTGSERRARASNRCPPGRPRRCPLLRAFAGALTPHAGTVRYGVEYWCAWELGRCLVGRQDLELVVARARLYFLVACPCVPLSLPRAGFLERWTDGCSAPSSPRPAGRRLSSSRHLSLFPSSSARLDSFRPSAVVKLTQRR